MSFKECVVPRCKHNNRDKPNKLFIRVPKDAAIRKKWAEVLKLKNIPDNPRYCCCEDHFVLSEDTKNWMFFKTIGQRLILNADVVPHQYIDTSPEEQLSSQFTDSAKKRKLEYLQQSHSASLELSVRKRLFVESPSKEICPAATPPKIKPPATNVGSPSGTFVVFEGTEVISPSTTSSCKRYANFGVQVFIRPNFRSIKIGTIEAKKKDACVMTHSVDIAESKVEPQTRSLTTTSSESSFSASIQGSATSEFQIPPSSSSSTNSELDEAEKTVFKENRKKSTISLVEAKSRFYLGLPKEIYVLVKLLTQWVNINYLHILVTLKKIRLNDAYSRLADDFGLSITSISKIFTGSTLKIANAMQSFIFWPEQCQIKRNLPITFRYRYSNVQSIIDCLEIEIEKPLNPLHQSLTWSEYKKCNTLKFLISCTPNGFINFISGAFTGRITDNKIVKDSGFLDCLPNNIDVMADRGFKQIDAPLSAKQCRLIRPPSVSSKEQPTRDQVRESKRISALRIHVERVIRRLREFEMTHMHTCLNHNLKYLMNHIVIISCALINLQEPLIK